jgi:hypothetical protein
LEQKCRAIIALLAMECDRIHSQHHPDLLVASTPGMPRPPHCLSVVVTALAAGVAAIGAALAYAQHDHCTADLLVVMTTDIDTGAITLYAPSAQPNMTTQHRTMNLCYESALGDGYGAGILAMGIIGTFIAAAVGGVKSCWNCECDRSSRQVDRCQQQV